MLLSLVGWFQLRKRYPGNADVNRVAIGWTISAAFFLGGRYAEYWSLMRETQGQAGLDIPMIEIVSGVGGLLGLVYLMVSGRHLLRFLR